jgi:hypothetical protein
VPNTALRVLAPFFYALDAMYRRKPLPIKRLQANLTISPILDYQLRLNTKYRT